VCSEVYQYGFVRRADAEWVMLHNPKRVSTSHKLILNTGTYAFMKTHAILRIHNGSKEPDHPADSFEVKQLAQTECP
jgi:hypothetical protein